MSESQKWLRTLCCNCILAPQNRSVERPIPCCLECSNKWVAAAEIERLQGICSRICAVQGCECDSYEGHKCLMCKVREIAREGVRHEMPVV